MWLCELIVNGRDPVTRSARSVRSDGTGPNGPADQVRARLTTPNAPAGRPGAADQSERIGPIERLTGPNGACRSGAVGPLTTEWTGPTGSDPRVTASSAKPTCASNVRVRLGIAHDFAAHALCDINQPLLIPGFAHAEHFVEHLESIGKSCRCANILGGHLGIRTFLVGREDSVGNSQLESRCKEDKGTIIQ